MYSQSLLQGNPYEYSPWAEENPGKGLKSYAWCLPGEVKEPQRTTYGQGPQDALGLQKKRTEMH